MITNNQKGFLPVALGILVLLIVVGGGIYYFGKLQKEDSVSVSSAPRDTQSPFSSYKLSSKILTLDGIQFEYPSDWKDPEHIESSFGQSAEIKNQDGTQRIVILSDLNKGSTEQELIEFLDFMVQGGAEKLTLDGSMATKSSVVYGGSNTTTIYVNAKDDKSQYSISLQVPESYPMQKVDELLNQIVSSFRFID